MESPHKNMNTSADGVSVHVHVRVGGWVDVSEWAHLLRGFGVRGVMESLHKWHTSWGPTGHHKTSAGVGLFFQYTMYLSEAYWD